METFAFTTADGVVEQVELSEWGWFVVYKDGSLLKQYDDETKQFHQFKEIDITNVETFVVLNLFDTDNLSKRFEFHMEEGMTPIFFTRVTIFNANEPDEYRIRVAHFGYKSVVNGVSVKTIMAAHPSGAISVRNTDGRDALESN